MIKFKRQLPFVIITVSMVSIKNLVIIDRDDFHNFCLKETKLNLILIASIYTKTMGASWMRLFKHGSQMKLNYRRLNNLNM